MNDKPNEEKHEVKTDPEPAKNPSSPVKEEAKILVVGDVQGKFEAVFSRVTQIMAKAGLFDLLVCVGEFFSNDPQSISEWKRYQSGEAAAPLDTLIMGPCSAENAHFYGTSGRQGSEIARSIYYLGHHGVYTTTSGVTIAYISGREDPAGSATSIHSFTSSDISDLRRLCKSHAKFNGVDMLLTAQWPFGVLNFSDQQCQADDANANEGAVESRLISELAVSVRPRYHFAGLRGAFFERRPYRNHRILLEPPRAVTRFIGLAPCELKTKKRFYYAYKMVPLYRMEHSELTRQPADTTECPYMDFIKLETAVEESQSESKASDGQAIWSNTGKLPSEKRFQEPAPPSQFFFDDKALRAAERRRQREQEKETKSSGPVPVKKRQSQCWFCLSSPEVEKHLVVSVANETYLAMAKGPLTEDNVLILPIAHHQSSVHCPEEVLHEIDMYKNSVRRFFHSEGKQPIFYERNVKSLHLQIQVHAVPGSHSSIKIKTVFQRAAQRLGQSFSELPRHAELSQLVGSTEPYFLVELPDGQRLLLRIQARNSNSFPLAFGRDLIASSEFLNLPNRVDWRQCTTGQNEETTVTQRFRRRFEPYDFSVVGLQG